jgi:ubiquinone/menaquinone biosynthesis C-methylase UbiE
MTYAPQPHTNAPAVSRFFAVDHVEEPNQLIDFLATAKSLPGIPEAKAEMLDHLAPEDASAGLDVGCGYGADVEALAGRMPPGGRTVGIDVSETMIAEARRRTAGSRLDMRFVVGDALALPFEDDTFDVCRIETVLQHVEAPGQAVAEMARVTRPVGRVAALEFDAGTVFLDHPDVEFWNVIWATFTHAAVQDLVGRQLPRLFVDAGLTGVRARPRVIPSDPGFFRLLLGEQVTELVQAGVFTPERVERWWTAMNDAVNAGHFTGGGTAFIVSGTVR